MKVILSIPLFFTLIGVYGQADLKIPFDDCSVRGSITIYNYKEKKWTSSDIHDSQVATLPASTFKIFNTLIALETGVIADENEIIKWPGKTDTAKYGNRTEIYHDMNLREAFKQSAVWVYLELAKRIGKERYDDYLSRSRYGNADLSIDDVDFWNFGQLAITPVNQIEILIGVYEETLPFSNRSFIILKEIMKEETTESYTLYAKTGWTRDEEKDIGWWIGYVEREDNTYFFATRITKDRQMLNLNFGKCRKQITKDILKQLDIL